ncbi:MAG: L-rhamnose isomerase [Armatimonadetes bacterium]|jgi:L-rhamnose isomerase|nr:L-rhamnose isomerase [Armatimonadota bacterium]
MIAALDAKAVERNYQAAQEAYAALGVDTEAALSRLAGVQLSLHCWQGDDVGGFENPGGELTGGIQATGNYPGKARTPDELRDDLETVFRLIPGRHRVALHAIYLDYPEKVERNALEPKHFQRWIDWAKGLGISLDFNGSFFSHPKSADGFTLSHPDPGIRRFWVEHAIACRHVSAAIGRAQGNPCVNNLWLPDGEKDLPADRWSPRARLREALDTIFAEEIPTAETKDAVESKLFGIGSESYVVGSLEFYLAYAVSRGKLLTLDTGHFHPTELVSDKISAVLQYVPEVLLHVSRGVRWDSDHVVVLSDEVRAIAEEVVRGNALDRVCFGLDFFDASINRVAAWTIGARATLKALLIALLEPTAMLQELEAKGDRTARLALMDELKSMPFAAVWDQYCYRNEVPVGAAWINEMRAYEARVLAAR